MIWAMILSPRNCPENPINSPYLVFLKRVLDRCFFGCDIKVWPLLEWVTKLVTQNLINGTLGKPHYLEGFNHKMGCFHRPNFIIALFFIVKFMPYTNFCLVCVK